MNTEFHVHTKYSHDSLLGKRSLAFMCRVKKIECVAITDHNEISGALEYRSWLARKGIQVIIGEEIFTDKGEIIGLFLTERIEPGLSPEETILRIREQNGIVYIPHPYDEKRFRTVLEPDSLRQCRAAIDCIEIHNGRNACSEFSYRQKEIATQNNLLPIVGGDSHTFIELGRNVCVTNEPFNRENFLENLASANFRTKPCLRISHRITRLVRALKLLSKGDLDGLRRAFNSRITRKK